MGTINKKIITGGMGDEHRASRKNATTEQHAF
jgi:hypothetical protein